MSLGIHSEVDSQRSWVDLLLEITLCEELRHALRTQEPIILNRNPYGQKYQIDFEMTRGDRQAIIKSVWIVRDDEDFPRLVTCYIP